MYKYDKYEVDGINEKTRNNRMKFHIEFEFYRLFAALMMDKLPTETDINHHHRNLSET